MYNFISFPCICQPKNLRNSYGFFLFYTRAQYISRFFCFLEEKFFLRVYLSRFSSASSILRTSSLGRISNASAILHIVEKFACFVPHSIIVKCVRAMPAKPLKTSCDMPFALRTDRIVCPTILFSQSKQITSTQIVCVNRHFNVYDNRQWRIYVKNSFLGCWHFRKTVIVWGQEKGFDKEVRVQVFSKESGCHRLKAPRKAKPKYHLWAAAERFTEKADVAAALRRKNELCVNTSVF